MEHILNCNLELCLSPPSSSATATATNSTSISTLLQHNHVVNRTGSSLPVTDLTELQARAIIIEATRQMDQEIMERRSTCRQMKVELATYSASPAEELSMKSGANPSMRRSLQRFLQKRKHRIQTISPYAR